MYQAEEDPQEAKASKIVKSILFLVIFCGILISVAKMLTSPGDYRNYQWVHGFYEEEEDTLDAVYIGSSATYAFWQAALGWDSHGIAVWPYAANGQPLKAVRFILEEVQKTQPDALKIINISSGDIGECSVSQIHWLTDYMPWSLTKLKLIHYLCETGDYELADRLEFYFSLYRYHSRWSELIREDLSYELDGTKGGSQYDSFLKNTKDVSKSYRETDRLGELSDEAEAYLESLFDYIDQENIQVLFVSNTSVTTSEIALAEVNQIMEMAEARGYSTLNMKNQQEEIGINTATDYYNTGHANVHGSIKYTEYLSDYLVEHYDFQDKRGQEGYESWDLAAEKYKNILAPYVVAEELNADAYDSSLQAPELSALKVNGTKLTLQWKEVEGADAYHIYRKQGASQPWKLLAEVTADTLSYQDTDLALFREYTYTVVPQRETDGKNWHGNYQFAGISATTIPRAPKLLELTGDSQSLTLTWKTVSKADGYAVFRKICGGSWIEVADVGKETQYTDTNLFGGEVPFQYTVRAYMRDKTGARILGSSDANGLLWLPQLQDIGLTASAESGRIVVSWEPVSGAGKYYIERRTKGGGWTEIAELISGEAAPLEDLTAEKGVAYQYRVTAALTYSKEEYRFASQETDAWHCPTQDSVVADSPEIVFARQIGQGIELVWTPASNAGAYRIYKKTETSDWTVLKESAAGNAYFDSLTAEGESAVSYIVQALYGSGGVVFGGEFSEDMAVTVLLEQEG